MLGSVIDLSMSGFEEVGLFKYYEKRRVVVVMEWLPLDGSEFSHCIYLNKRCALTVMVFLPFRPSWVTCCSIILTRSFRYCHSPLIKHLFAVQSANEYSSLVVIDNVTLINIGVVVYVQNIHVCVLKPDPMLSTRVEGGTWALSVFEDSAP